MIGTNRKVRVWAYPRPCDLRKGHNGLNGLVRREFESEPERLRQVVILKDAEIGKSHEVVARLAREVDNLKETKHGQLQQELREVKDFLNRLQHLQFGRSSEKRTTGRRRRRRKRRTPAPQTDLPIVE